MPRVLAAAAVAFGVSAGVTWAVRALGRWLGWYARVREDRWHRGRVVLYGGVGIAAGFAAAFALFRPAWVRGDLLFAAACGAMFLLGLVDDLRGLGAASKLVGQFAAAAGLTAFGLRLHWTGVAALDVGLTLLWLVGLANAVNLLDNMDGLAAGVATVAGAALALVFWDSGELGQARLAAMVAGAALGFLVFNVNPASIFMGDAGSLLLGFALAGLAVLDEPGRARGVGAWAAPLLVLAVPILDTALVTVTRPLVGRKVVEGGTDHTSHRLVALGLSERAAVGLLWALAALGGAVAFLVRRAAWTLGLPLVLLYGVVASVFVAYLARHGADRPARPAGLAGQVARWLAESPALAVAADLVLILVAYFGAFLLRWGRTPVPGHERAMLHALPAVVVLQLSSFLAAGLYRSLWRYVDVRDVLRIAAAVAAGVGASVVFAVGVFRFYLFSRVMFLLDGLLLFVLVTASRYFYRSLRTWLVPGSAGRPRRPALVYGAGDAGELVAQEARRNEAWALKVVGFVDDDPAKRGRRVAGLPVLGTLEDLEGLLEGLDVELVVISSARIPREKVARVRRVCQDLGLACLRLRMELEEVE